MIDYIHELHPYDELFLVPLLVTAMLFWKQRNSHFTFLGTLLGSVIASAIATVFIMTLMMGPWPLIGVTLGLVATLYVPVCAAVGLVTRLAAKHWG